MRFYKKILFAIIVLLLVVTSLSSCDNNAEQEPENHYFPTSDIVASIKESSYSAEFDKNDIDIFEVEITVPDNIALTVAINNEIGGWIGTAIKALYAIDEQLGVLGGENYFYAIKNKVTYNRDGLLSVICSLEYTEYGETYSVTLKSGVWNMDVGEQIDVHQMLNLSSVDYENFLTVNLDNAINSFGDSTPVELKNAAGLYSGVIDYYIGDGGCMFYLSYDNMDYITTYTEFVLRFEEAPSCYNYKLQFEK